MALWGTMLPELNQDQRKSIVHEAIQSFEGTSLSDIRGDREKLLSRATQIIQASLSRQGLQCQPVDIEEMTRAVIAHVIGLGFLEPLLRLDTGLSEIAVNPDGTVWGIVRGEQDFERLPHNPGKTEMWRAVETILAPLGRSLSEASPSVDAKIARSPQLPGGARVKMLHPILVPGDGYPAMNVRLFNPQPVPPEQLIKWEMAPAVLIDELVSAVRDGMRVLIIGGTATGKTTVLSALAHGIPGKARALKIEDPEEIWLKHPHVVTIEARPAQVGSTIKSYILGDGVDDAMRMSPRWLIVGEMRKGDAINALFRAQMSDHPGLSTFHAESPEACVKRMVTILGADAGMPAANSKEMFAEAVDLVVQVGFRPNAEGRARRKITAVHQVRKTLKSGNVDFRTIFHLPGEDTASREARLNAIGDRIHAAHTQTWNQSIGAEVANVPV